MATVFVYNRLMLGLYSFTLSLALSFYIRYEKKLYLFITFFLLFLILDNIIVYMTEFLNSFASSYNQNFMRVPVAKTIIYLVLMYCTLSIITTMLKEKLNVFHYSIWSGLAVWLLGVQLLPNSAFKVWIYYLPYQLFTVLLGIYILNKLKTHEDVSSLMKKYLKSIAIFSIIAAICILFEDSFVIFNFDKYTTLDLKINNRNLCDDLYSVGLCLIASKYFLFDYKMTQKIEEESMDEQQQFHSFCTNYGLTEREKEVCCMLLNHKQNQEIADDIHLSIGTVKTHVHNIFVKLDVKKRNKIFERYDDFQQITSIKKRNPVTAIKKPPTFHTRVRS